MSCVRYKRPNVSEVAQKKKSFQLAVRVPTCLHALEPKYEEKYNTSTTYVCTVRDVCIFTTL